MKFYLGTHHPNWLGKLDVPLFVSWRVLRDRKTLPVASAPWALDSGGFTELTMHGGWRWGQEDAYVKDVLRFNHEIGQLDWVAPMDWMCEPHMLEKTGMDVQRHRVLTVQNFQRLRARMGPIVIPVLQGWERDDYLRCWELYEQAGFDLTRQPVVGLGTVCRRQDTVEAGRIVRALSPLRLHGFGVKKTGLLSFGDALESADSMAWSFNARMNPPLLECAHKSCANCPKWAMSWRKRLLEQMDQLRLWEGECLVAC